MVLHTIRRSDEAWKWTSKKKSLASRLSFSALNSGNNDIPSIDYHAIIIAVYYKK